MMKRGFLAFFLLATLPALPSWAEAGGFKVKVTVDMANVRAKPDLSGTVIAMVPRGTILEADEQTGNWLRVKISLDMPGKTLTGYIHKNIVEIVAEKSAGAPAAKSVGVGKAAPAAPKPASAPPQPEPAKPIALPPAGPVGEPGGAGKLTLAFLGGAGVTLVNLDEASGYPALTDWGTFHFQFKLQGFYRLGAVDLGIEFGYNDLYWWYLRAPYGTEIIYRENSIGTWNISGVVQLAVGSGFFLQAGAGMHIFFDGVTPGLMVAAGYSFRLSDRLSLPLFARADLIFGDGTPSPFSAGAGLRIRL